ncbi:MAG TPA: hypothetical protein VNO43_13290, partial [Candidatus Eisenbacteria bacterium]|nr:hypothetical protein [Candidatus Eisenbacteria bacterium]
DTILGELVSLKTHLQDELQQKLGAVASAAHRARNLAIAFMVALLALGLAASFLMSRSIADPLTELKRVVENPESELTGLSRWSNLPEVYDLARALEDSRRRLQEVARSQAAFARAIRNRHLTQLVSVRKRLDYLKEQAGQRLNHEQSKQIDTLSAEIERLIVDCSNLTASWEEPAPGAESVSPSPASATPVFTLAVQSALTRARDWPVAFWSGLKASAPRSIWKGEKR